MGRTTPLMSRAKGARILARGFALLTLAAAMALGAVCADPKQQQQDGGTAYAPQGDVARLRLEVLNDTVSCDGGKQELQVWLDDLPRQPTITQDALERSAQQNLPTPAPSTTGVIAYQFKLRYDPAVVRVEDRADVQVPAELDRSGPATSVDRNFTATARVDNFHGHVFAGGLALGLAAGMDPGDVDAGGVALAPGIDPVAAGRSLLIMTVALTPVGEGRTTLALDEAELVTDYDYRMVPLEIVPTSVTVQAGGCVGRDTATPLTTPTSMPVTPTPVPQVTTAAVTPQPAAGVRPDCPEGWAVADEARFSFCYPANLHAVRMATGGTKVAYNVASPPPIKGEAPLNQIFVSVARQAGRSFSPDVECENVTVIPAVTQIEPVAMIVDDGRSFTGCLSHGTDSVAGRAFEMQAYLVDIDLADGEYIAVLATNTGPLLLETRQAVEAILQTVRTK